MLILSIDDIFILQEYKEEQEEEMRRQLAQNNKYKAYRWVPQVAQNNKYKAFSWVPQVAQNNKYKLTGEYYR